MWADGVIAKTGAVLALFERFVALFLELRHFLWAFSWVFSWAFSWVFSWAFS